MSTALAPPRMTRAQFFAWAQQRDRRYEFDGEQPVAMTGGTIDHNRITLNVHRALAGRLASGPCRALGPDAGIATVGDTVRYPDQLVTCTRISGNSHLVDRPVLVVEILSPGSGQTDRIVKVREYAAVPTIMRYLIVESAAIGLLLLERDAHGDPWRTTAFAQGDTITLADLGLQLPIDEFYEDVDLDAQPVTTAD